MGSAPKVSQFAKRKRDSLVTVATATEAAAIAATATTAAAETATATAAAEAATLAAAEATTLATTEAAALAATEAAASGAIFLRTGLIHGQLTTTELDAIGLLGGHLGLLSGAHGHEREAARTTGHAIEGDINVGNSAELLKLATKCVGSRLEGQISDVEFGTCHVMIS